MTKFSWLAELATRDRSQALLISPERQWTAGDIHDNVATLRDHLAGSRVLAVLADNSPPWVMAELACHEAGIVHLPLPAFFTARQLRHALDTAGADSVLTDQPERIGALDLGFSVVGNQQGLIWMRRAVEPVALPAGTAKITFTSGSTGAPKGVCLSAAGLHDTARAVHERLADLPLERHLAVMPLSLLLENVAGVHAPLLRGTPVHLPPLAQIGWKGMSGFDPAALAGTLNATACSSVILVPELLKALTLFLAASGRRAPESLRLVAVGGARVSSALIREARRAGIPAYQGYGLSEGGSVLTLNRPGDDSDGVGRPLAHAQLWIEDGEVVAKTRAFLGYTGSPAALEKTSAAGELVCFPTGDLGNFDGDGHLHLAGRSSNLLITSYGRNVAPEWLEAELLADPAVMQAIVVGDGLPVLSAVIVPRPATSPAQIDALIGRINAGLPDYAQIAHWLNSEPFTPENGMATGNGRPSRNRISEYHYAALAAQRSPMEPADVLL